MATVLVYFSRGDIKKKLFPLLNLSKECSFCFIQDPDNFAEDLNTIQPRFLILEDKIFFLLKREKNFLSMTAGIEKLIIIKTDNPEIVIPPGCNSLIIQKDFTVGDLSGILSNCRQIDFDETNLRIETGFLQILMDNIPDTIYFKDRQCRFTRINKAKAQLLNIQDPSEAIGKIDNDFFDSARAKKAFIEEQKLMQTGIPVINKVEKIETGNKKRYVSATKIPIKDTNGNIVGLVGVSRDITRNKEFEEKLLREQSLLKALMNNVPDKIFFKDRDSKFVRVNKAWAEKYNLFNAEEVVGKADEDFFPKTFAEETYREEQALMESGIPLVNKLEKKVREGKESFKQVTKVPIRAKSGFITGLVGISHDITDLKMAELSLAREKELLQSLMDNIPDLIYFKDRKSKFIRINQGQAFILGLNSPAESIGKTDYDFFPPNEAEIFYNEEQEIFRSGKSIINLVEKVTPPNGDPVWMSTTKIPVRDERGNITGLVGISRDITILEQAREKLEFAKQKAEEANLAKSQFLANMSHEIRTPMNGVIGMADILSCTRLDTEQQNYLDIIIKSGNNLLSIINDILDLSKIEANNLTLEKAPFCIRDIMEDVSDILIIAANNRNLELSNFVDPDIPELTEGDSVRIRQILINLVNNAIKFTNQGEVFFSAEVEDRTSEDIKVLFKVKDTGIGISKDSQSALFQPFSQVDNSSSRRYEGTGLGLAISKKLCEMMGGSIGVVSEAGEGSLFWFNAWFGISQQKKSTIKPINVNIEDLNVLIVDDNKTNRFVFSKYLENWNCRYQTAPNGPAAIKMMTESADRGNPFNVALLDYQMPGMDGLALAEIIRSDQKIADTRLILLSSVSDAVLPGQVNEKGFKAFLNKPVKLKDLYRVITMMDEVKTEREIDHKFTRNTNANLRVLIAEDNLINVKVAQLIVRPFATLIDVVENGQLAFEKYLKEAYDLILMDLQMPVIDGYQAAEMIRNYEMMTGKTPVKIIAMTANAMKEDVELCLKIGMDEYLTKPFRTEDLLIKLKNVGLAE